MSNLNTKLVELPKSRARHQVKRSLTELTSPGRLPRLHHPSHAHHDDRGLPDAHEPLQTRHSISLFRPDVVASTMSPDLSRRPSLSAQGEGAGEAEMERARNARLRMEQEKAKIRVDVLKQSLGRLGKFSTDMTKQLDDTYYAVLEKMSSLQSTVTAMRGLAEGLHDMCDGFDNDARVLESDTASQLAVLGRFEEQEAKISSLQSRVRQGRTRIQCLTDRVDVVKERIEGWERADKDWQEKTRKRLKIFWSVTSAVAILMLALAVGVKYATPKVDGIRRGPSGAGTTMRPWLNASHPSVLPADGGDEQADKTIPWRTAAADDERLRVLDEL